MVWLRRWSGYGDASMSGISKKLMGTTAAGGEFLAIEDVFSTYLYDGNGSTQTITNDIDLAGEGGLVWLKSRSLAEAHQLFDTERGIYNRIFSNVTNAQSTNTNTLTAFNSDGFSIGDNNISNTSGSTNVSWTFRKAPRFFDVVTYTGTGSARTVDHNLGSAPGMIIVKATNKTDNWIIYHRSEGATKYGKFTTDEFFTNSSQWNNTEPTDTVFTVNTDGAVNDSGDTYVAYLFAHDPLGPSGDGSDGLIACGSYTGNGSADGLEVELGWEPQWVLIKQSSASGENWLLIDVMRGMTNSSGDGSLYPNLSNAENADARAVPQATGFKLTNGAAETNGSGETYIYIAIRRGPMRVPESGTEVFAVSQPADTARATTIPFFEAGFAPDAAIDRFNKNSTFGQRFSSRMTGPVYMFTNATDAEASNVYHDYNTYMDGYYTNLGTAQGGDDVAWMFRRAPGFFDVVAYTGDGSSSRLLPHNLAATPELVIIKNRGAVYNWPVTSPLLGDNPAGKLANLYLDTTMASAGGEFFNTSGFTETTIGLRQWPQVNDTGNTYIAYLFATLPGVSKVGSYTGNGSSQTIDCGFTSGARFIIIKRTDDTGDWYVWDTARGIVAGDDPHLSLNTTAAEVTSDDSIDPESSGFIVNQVAATDINVSAASYIFYSVS
jgi:hypothetical protein